MSFVPAPQQANAASANKSSTSNAVTSSTQAPASAADADAQDKDHVFKMRTFDVFWVEKSALMYKDGIAKVSFLVLLLFSRDADCIMISLISYLCVPPSLLCHPL